VEPRPFELRVVGGAAAGAPPFDPRALLQRFGGDEGLMGEVMGMFLSDARGMLDGLRAAVDAGDARRIEADAHTLKGCLGELCASLGQELARELETAARERRVEEARQRFRPFEAAVLDLLVALDAHARPGGAP
jgi:HPt (histidine-containing phosphotransfer) domain-containing protein